MEILSVHFLRPSLSFFLHTTVLSAHQVEFDGAGKDSSRKRPNVPTLGPLSYSLPVTPQGRGGNNASWDGEMFTCVEEMWSILLTIMGHCYLPQSTLRHLIGLATTVPQY